MDPISDQFPHVSTYNYAENEPVAHIDLWGLQKAPPKENQNIEPNLPEVVVKPENSGFPSQDFESNTSNLTLGQWQRKYGCEGCTQTNTESYYNSSTSEIQLQTQNNPSWWNSSETRKTTGDAISLSLNLNTFGVGGSTVEGGVLFIIRGPEAPSLKLFGDGGLGVGMEFSAGVNFSKYNVLTSNVDDIRSANFEGLRVDGSISAPNIILGTFNLGLNIPIEGQPFILRQGYGLGVGVTSPFNVGGNFNLGYTGIK